MFRKNFTQLLNFIPQRETVFHYLKKNTAPCAALTLFSIRVFAQSGSSADGGEGSGLFYPVLAVIGFALVGLAVWMRVKKKNDAGQTSKTQTSAKNSVANKDANAKNSVQKKKGQQIQPLNYPESVTDLKLKIGNGSFPANAASESFAANQPAFQQNANTFNDTAELATNSANYWQLKPPAAYDPLPQANDESVLDAIEQLNEDEEDEAMRSLAMRVLSASKTEDAVEGLQFVALYDQSATRRGEAVTALGTFDHESVFEPILMACADSSREVRAAAARALTRLSFDRGDAFARVAGSGDVERMRLSAVACVESGFAGRAFERLSTPDRKQSYEAYVILTLLVKAKHFEPILQTIAEHPNPQVRLATIKVLYNLNPVEMFTHLQELSRRNDLPEDAKTALQELIFHLSAVA